MKRLVIACLMVTLAALAGCKDEQTTTSNGYPHSSAVLYYTYPMNGQVNVAPHTPIVLTYMDQIAATKGDFILKPANGPAVAIASVDTVTDGYKPLVKGGTSLVIHPAEPLDVNTKYVLTSKHNAVPLPQGKLTFTVRPALRGAVNTTITSSTFKVASLTPDGSQLPVVDFSTFDVVFSQPLKVQSVQYGTNVMLKQGGNLVPATVLVNDRKMTIDPDYCLAQPEAQQAQCREQENGLLKPGVPVTISLTSGIKSVVETGGTNESLQAFSQTVTPKNSAPRAVMVQKAQPASTNGCDAPDALKSALTGMSINCVPVRAKLLGDTTTSGQQGDIYAQLAFAPHFPKKTPLRIKKGALLQGTELAVNIGGHVPAGFSSGDVTVTFLSDANGYLLPNPYTDDPSAPKRLIITSDMAFDTADPRANGAFTQNLLHVTLIGSAIANPETGILKVDAVGIVEPSVLGIENAYGVLSFHMESYPDQANLPKSVEAVGGSRALRLISWVPGSQVRKTVFTEGKVVKYTEICKNKESCPTKNDPSESKIAQSYVSLGAASNVSDMLRPGDPILLTFNKPLDKTSIKPGQTVTLTLSNQPKDFTWRLNGTTLSIYPKGGLAYTTQHVVGGVSQSRNEATYQVSYGNGLKGVSGDKPITGTKTVTFTMPLYADVDSSGNDGALHSPVITAMYPGFPCVTTTGGVLPYDQGYCESNPVDGQDGSVENNGDPVDRLPVMPMPANRAIHIQFSQQMKPESIRLGDTFVVEKCTATTGCGGATAVAGQLSIDQMKLTFTPDTPWEAGVLYRYTLKSDKYVVGNGVCSSTGSAICAVGDHPLITAPLLSQYGYNEGGPALTNYFVGAASSDNVLQMLRNLPTTDVDASFKHDVGEVEPYNDPTLTVADPPDNPRAALNSARVKVKGIGSSSAITAANVGCATGSTCPNGKYLYMTGSLMADITGFKTAAEIRHLVTIGAFPATAVPAVLKAGNSPSGTIEKGAILAYIYPTQILATGLLTYTDAVVGNAPPASTGTQVLRMRYTCDPMAAAGCDNPAHGRIPGWIVESSQAGHPPQFYTILDLYMDAPNMQASVTVVGINFDLTSNLHNYKISMNLAGPLTFLPDGRLQIGQKNSNKVELAISLGGIPLGLTANVNLVIPPDATILNYVGYPIEN